MGGKWFQPLEVRLLLQKMDGKNKRKYIHSTLILKDQVFALIGQWRRHINTTFQIDRQFKER